MGFVRWAILLEFVFLCVAVGWVQGWFRRTQGRRLFLVCLQKLLNFSNDNNLSPSHKAAHLPNSSMALINLSKGQDSWPRTVMRLRVSVRSLNSICVIITSALWQWRPHSATLWSRSWSWKMEVGSGKKTRRLYVILRPQHCTGVVVGHVPRDVHKCNMTM